MVSVKEPIKKISETVRVLGHPARIEILILLNKRKKMSVTEIYEQLGLSQPETSRHLSVLKSNGVLLCEKTGSVSNYYINEDNLFVKDFVVCLCKK